MRQFREVGAVLCGILRIMHPDQYRLGLETRTAMQQYGRVRDTLLAWPILFSAVTIIANRACPMHREPKGHFHLFDILVSVGSYSSAPFMTEPLGIQVKNSPGTVCGFSGRLCRHGVTFADGARIAYALYMKPEIPKFANVYPCSWMAQDVYREQIGDNVESEKFVYKSRLYPL